jgi:Family of unknown function (DUF5681)
MHKKRSKLRRRPLGDYEVGKCRPPLASRWKPGQCGNPKGRPKKAYGAATMARKALDRPLPVIVGSRKAQMTVREIAYRKLGDKAAAGDQKALYFLLDLANEHQPLEPGSSGDVLSAHQNEIIQQFLKRHQQRGNDEP